MRDEIFGGIVPSGNEHCYQGYEKYDGLEIDSTSAAILFESYALIFVFEQIIVLFVYVGRFAVILFILMLFYFNSIHLYDHNWFCIINIYTHR